MADYEEYGSSFRTPRAMRPDGGPANNGFQQYDGQPSQTEGRPPAEEEDPLAKKKPGTAAATTSQSQPQAPAPAPTAGMTFSQMQQQGFARPPAPAINQQVGSSMGYGGVMTNPGLNQPVLKPASDTGNRDLEGSLWNAYNGTQGAKPPTFEGEDTNSPMNQTIQQKLMEALGNPSRYDANVVKDSFGYLSGAIDDDYNARDQGLKESIASRGLGAVGDGTIGASDQRFQNLQRRSAKQNLASELLREQANTYGSDRSSALNDAMGYGNNRFNNKLGAFNANLGAQGQYFNQGQQAANQLMNYGQNQFQNQYQTSLMNQNQQNQQMEYLMKMLGYGG